VASATSVANDFPGVVLDSPGPMTIDQLFHAAQTHHRNGQLTQAESAFRQLLSQQPNHAPALYGLGMVCQQTGRLDEAADLIAKAADLQPNPAFYHFHLGVARLNQRRFAEAAQAFHHLSDQRPGDAVILNNLAVAYCAMGEFDKAISAANAALAFSTEPAGAQNTLAQALLGAGRVDEAIEAFQAVVALKPDLVQAREGLGQALGGRGDHKQAVEQHQAAVALQPGSSSMLASLGGALWADGKSDKAIDALQQALKLEPSNAMALNTLANISLETGRLAQARELYQKAVDVSPDRYRFDSNRIYAMHFDPACDAQTLLREHQVWDRRHALPLMPRQLDFKSTNRDPNRRLRIGYVSPDFRRHVVGWNLLPLLSNHDPRQVEVFCYSAVSQPDEMTQRLRDRSDTWHNITALTEQKCAELIRADQIDILVDLTLHSAAHRLLVFARKPAPVQATYLAYCGTSGMTAMDWRLSDPYLDGPEADLSVYSEKTVRLPHTFWCYQPGGATPEVSATPALTSGHVTYGCLNKFSKVSKASIDLWAKLLSSVKGSKLLLHSPLGSHRAEALARFEAGGARPEQIEFIDPQPLAQYVRTYQRIDVALDPFPFGGGITTCDSLWMGVPVVTLSGRTAVGRGGRSILSNVGLPELVAQTPDEYLRIAADWEKWIKLRGGLRSRLAASPLMNAKEFAREVEAAYRQMWLAWCEGPR
jgi:protein O-GlcNAc transferase